MNLFLADEHATETFAKQVLAALPETLGGWTLLLSGELGAGKSTFARAMIRAAGHQGAIPSPTYTLVEPYKVARGNIYHVDLYRVSDEEELRYLGWNEMDDGFRLVEWPGRAPGLRDEADLALALAYDGDCRVAELTSLSERGQQLVEALSSANSED